VVPAHSTASEGLPLNVFFLHKLSWNPLQFARQKKKNPTKNKQTNQPTQQTNPESFLKVGSLGLRQHIASVLCLTQTLSVLGGHHHRLH